MPRNFVRRIEVMCPDRGSAPASARLLDEVLGVALRDNVKARRLSPDGSYLPRRDDGRAAPAAQAALLEGARIWSSPDATAGDGAGGGRGGGLRHLGSAGALRRAAAAALDFARAAVRSRRCC